MKYENVIKLAHKNNWEVEHKKFRYWDNVLYVNNTAMCFMYYNEKYNNESIGDYNTLPFGTKNNIILSVQNNLACLGYFVEPKHKAFGQTQNFCITKNNYFEESENTKDILKI